MTIDGKKTEKAGPDFHRINAWVFDLDNTLYPAGSNVFPQIHARMTVYISRLLGLSHDEALALQHAYYRAYGTTLSGLMARHHIDPNDYLSFVHDIDLGELHPDPELHRALDRLPGLKLVFTNGSREHAERILERLRLSGQIGDIWDIRKSAFIPKPAAGTYRRMVEKTHINPKTSVFFEDLARNLVPAHEMGMTTVWLNPGASWGAADPGFSSASRAHINHETGNLAGFLLSLRI
jgi:putative hydrolase of the HAD superfamily